MRGDQDEPALETLEGVELVEVAAIEPHGARAAKGGADTAPSLLGVVDQGLRPRAHPLGRRAVEVDAVLVEEPLGGVALTFGRRCQTPTPHLDEHGDGLAGIGPELDLPLDLGLELFGLLQSRHQHQHVAALEPRQPLGDRERLPRALRPRVQDGSTWRQLLEPELGQVFSLRLLAGLGHGGLELPFLVRIETLGVPERCRSGFLRLLPAAFQLATKGYPLSSLGELLRDLLVQLGECRAPVGPGWPEVGQGLKLVLWCFAHARRSSSSGVLLIVRRRPG